ncbi:phenoloxidase-activating factor 3-like [Sabethes cyaneus]|uniref:phenoloxidase-activating factor 3-like n=1 Tax=Sabethes cyaneus TaxID=53552 RepID=UPI00237E4FE2|nr:phenoloxidase-activating factor 3-like [Sabethes cyaneus]
MKTVFIAILSAMLVTVSCKRKVLLECGIPKIWAQELITNAQDTAPGDWPWHAAIFRRKGHSTDYVCGGTVISEEFIVTAAHCVMNAANGFQLAPNRIFVRLGIHDLHVINPEFIQQHEVGKIFKFANFTRFVDDIALLKLSTIIRFTDYVQPACVNLEPNITGEYGTVVGWGLTENDETSPILKKADIPVIDPVACLKTDRVLFGRTLDDGLFCAGYTNGTGVCNGDSGGGLFFRRANSWFLGGIVSFSQIRSDGYKNCYMKGYGAFTKVHHYVPWISEIMGMSFQRNNAVQVCKAVEPNQTSLSSKLLPRHCGVYIPNRIIGGVQAKVFEFPWMALLLENDKPYMCQGTLISKRYILTAAHCFGYSLPDKVHLGEHTIDQDVDCNDRDEDCAPPVREYDIECITTHPEFSWTTFADDVALVRLSEEVRCEDHIQPICLPHTSGLRNYQPPRYIVTGWGDDTDRLYRKISNILFKVTNLLAPHAECYQYRPNNITEKQLCVGPMGFGGPCIGEGGAPLGYGAKLYGMRFVQFGIDSIGELCGSGPKFYSNVSYYMDWIIANMKP